MRSILLAALALPALAQPELALPVDCTLGTDCWVQSVPDRDPGPGVADFACGGQSYDGHKGTDIRLATRAHVAAGIAVLAAAAGIVTGTRDGMADRPIGDRSDVTGRECGNGVVVDHGGGWVTQYCHLRRGSVAVARGDRVAAGARLGEIGLSGFTEFPHLHLSVRRDGVEIDPFDGVPLGADCAESATALWAATPAIGPAVITLGFADRVPAFSDVRAGTVPPPGTPPVRLVAWVHAIALGPGDVLRLRLRDPDGAIWVEDSVEMTRNRASQFRAVGRDRPPAPGRWTAEAAILRGGEVIRTRTLHLEVP